MTGRQTRVPRRLAPYCNLQLSVLQGALADIREPALVAISPQTLDQSSTLAERHAIEYPVLSDAGNAVVQQDGSWSPRPRP